MSVQFHALRQFKANTTFKKGDVLVLFGELFTRGYANGLVETAEKRGMKIIRTTVGRRDKDGQLRPLNAEEAALVPSPFINIPLEAGFDYETNSQGLSPIDLLKDVKLSDWENFKLDKSEWAEAQKKGQERFLKNLNLYLVELEKHIPKGANVFFAHLMAGGVPRAKIIMPLMNRAFKGTGERYLASEKLWNSSIGQLIQQSFLDVTAETFHQLIRESSGLRQKIENEGGLVTYSAYGYHGTEILFGKQYIWQTYSPYLQGWAKMRMEEYALDWTKKSVRCCVYNCPEILTNSSSIFDGVEVSLYPLMASLLQLGQDHPKAQAVLKQCQSLLKPDENIENLLKYTEKFLSNDLIRSRCQFEKWPQHSSKEQMELMLDTSEYLRNAHANLKALITSILSEVVIDACGAVMLNDGAQPESPVSWINHDLVTKTYLSL